MLPVALIVVVLGGAATGLVLSLRARRFGLALYTGIALSGCLAIDLAGGVPWIVGKALAISSPAVLTAGLVGGAMLWARRRVAGGLLIAMIAGGVLWSNALGCHDATLAPVGPLDDLTHIGRLVRGSGPTFVDDFEPYADRYFLRAGDPVEPSELRYAVLPLSDGTVLTKLAAADLDSFAVSTLTPYRSIVTSTSPTESRPSSLYRLVWSGRYYELWQRPARPTETVLAHIPFGDSTTTPYCGTSELPDGRSGPAEPICSIQPVATATCGQIRPIVAYASDHHAVLVAAERPENIYALGDQIDRPVTLAVTPSAHSITPLAAGQASLRYPVRTATDYSLWLGGSFGRGFAVSLDGRTIGRVENQLSAIDGHAPVRDVELSAGVHTLTLTYPGPDLAPGSGDGLPTTLSSVIFAPISAPLDQLATISPPQATSLCGKSVDWIEVVTSRRPAATTASGP